MSYNKDMSIAMNALAAYTTSIYYPNSSYGVDETERVSTLSRNDEQKQANAKTNEIEDTATVSPEAMSLYKAEQSDVENSNKDEMKKDDAKENARQEKVADNNQKELTESEQKEVEKLETTDKEVRAHEQAHKAAAGGINASAASYQTEKGPDGKDYAVAGEVSVSFTEGTDAQKNLEKAETMRRAALAPAEPSSQDLRVAQHASQLISEYTQEIQDEKTQSSQDETDKTPETQKPQDNNEEVEQTPSDKQEKAQEEITEPIYAAENVEKEAPTTPQQAPQYAQQEVKSANVSQATTEMSAGELSKMHEEETKTQKAAEDKSETKRDEKNNENMKHNEKAAEKHETSEVKNEEQTQSESKSSKSSAPQKLD